MSIKELWSLRSKHHLKKMMRYMKYVFNDHFVIVLVFLLGAIGYAYSGFIQNLSPNFIFGKMMIGLVFTAVLFIGDLATLIQPADTIFLLPKEREMNQYFKLAKRHSLFLPTVVLVFTVAAAMPLLVATSAIAFSDWFYFLLYLFLLKDIELGIRHVKLKLVDPQQRRKAEASALAVFLLVNVLALYVSPLLGILIAAGANLFFRKKVTALMKSYHYQWEYMVEKEQRRLHRIYQFINLFTDIPALRSSVKRRAYLDGLLKFAGKEHRKTFHYLFARVFLRGTEYSGLYIRLTVISVVLVAFSGSFILSSILALLFLYLTGFQLLPLYFHFDHVPLTSLYPVNELYKMRALQTLLQFLLFAQGAFLWAASLVFLPFLNSLLLLVLVLLFGFLFSRFYVPHRIRRLDKMKPY